MSRVTTARMRPQGAVGVRFHDHHPTPADLREEVLVGLAATTKRLSPKFFYDQRGSRLFDAITELPEYYPTRTEIDILVAHGAEMAEHLGRGQVLVELGSGSSRKIQILLSALAPSVYMPVDISREHLLDSAETLALHFPALHIEAVCADYSGPFALPLDPGWGRPAAFFPGSSIGNFEPAPAARLLRRVAAVLGAGGRLLIGVDLVKDLAVLEAAYNDAQGVTAEFNLNLLARINRELGADFDLGAFVHQARFNPAPDPALVGGPGRIEMHLISTRDQQVRVAGRVFDFGEGEGIHTESSYKYDLAGFRRLAAEAGFHTEAVWTDPGARFSVHCLRVGTPPAAP